MFKGADGWRWRLRSSNGKVLATSECYSSKSKAEQTATAVKEALSVAKIEVPLS